MKIGVIADIHGYVVPLDAVLADLATEQPDQIICLGDVAAPGPQGHECLDRLRKLGCLGVIGNGDDRMLHILEPAGEAHIIATLHERGILDQSARHYLENDRWCARQLLPEDWAYLRSFQPTVEVALGEDANLFCFHGTPHSFNEGISSSASPEELARILSGYEASVMACAHIHVQMIRRHRNTLLFNPGSAGGNTRAYLPGSEQWCYASWAEYALVHWDRGRVGIELRRVPFDRDRLIASIRASQAPHTEWLLKVWT